MVAALHDATIGRRAFHTVVLVGHSYGSEIAKLEASTGRDVDALILTGSAHTMSASAMENLAQFGQPVEEIPRLAAEVPAGDSGYGLAYRSIITWANRTLSAGTPSMHAGSAAKSQTTATTSDP